MGTSTIEFDRMQGTTGGQLFQKTKKRARQDINNNSHLYNYLTSAENCVEWVLVTSTELFRGTSIENCQEEYIKALRCCSTEASSDLPQA